MFDSVCIGLRYFLGRCDRVFFCPVDVPLFSEDTVRKEIENADKADFILPFSDRITGHPVLMSQNAMEYTLSYNGDVGMRGAYTSFEQKYPGSVLRIEVNDIGSTMDADNQNIGIDSGR